MGEIIPITIILSDGEAVADFTLYVSPDNLDRLLKRLALPVKKQKRFSTIEHAGGVFHFRTSSVIAVAAT
jgi:thioredoxin-like negative regulator of GroEL